MSERGLEQLYAGEILALAADIAHAGRLEGAAAEVRKRSPLCGSSVLVGLNLKAGRIAAFAQDVKTCALGQASASVLGAQVIGLGRDEIAAGRDGLKAMLTADGTTPPAPFEALEALRPAAAYPTRHPSILLAWEATLAAFDQAMGGTDGA